MSPAPCPDLPFLFGLGVVFCCKIALLPALTRGRLWLRSECSTTLPGISRPVLEAFVKIPAQRLSIPVPFSWLLMKNVAVWSFINPSRLSLFRKCFSGCSLLLQNCRAPIQAGAEQSGCVQTQCAFSPRTTFI